MGNSLQCGKMPGQFKLPKFQYKNQYLTKNLHEGGELSNIAEQIAPGCDYQKIKNITQYIDESPDLVFVDSNFSNLQAKGKNGQMLSVLYDYKKQKIDRLYSRNSTSLQILNQKQVEIAYSSAVFYLLCQEPNLKDTIILTRHVNIYHAYLFRMFCNGCECIVAVDDSIPAEKDKILYLNIMSSKELWPILLQKAWMKQIGGYEKAKGLSPEDCFEQITGIPAYSIRIKDYHDSIIQERFETAIKDKHWVILTGHETDKQICSRQIFYLEDIYSNNTLMLRSPYQTFDISGSQKMQGAVKLSLNKAMQLFEYATFGYYKPGYQPTSIPIRSNANEQVIIELTVSRQQPINIRFQQFYQEYLDYSEKEFYMYSPSWMQLYDDTKSLMLNCQGIPQSIEGIRSSHLSKDIFSTLHRGKYYLRLQVNWVNEKQLNQGNVVVYSSEGNVRMQKYQGNHKQLAEELVMQSLESSHAQQINKDEQNLVVKWLEKQYSYILKIQNIDQKQSNLQIHFKGSQNICINHHQLSKDLKLEVKVEGNSFILFEIVPRDPHLEFYLAPFDIVKL